MVRGHGDFHRGDAGPLTEALRRARQEREPDALPSVALAGPRALHHADLVREAGCRLVGRLAGSPFEDGGWAGGQHYRDLEALAADVALDGVVLDGTAPDLAAGLPDLLAAGLRVLLPDPAPLDPDLLREARQAGGALAVGLLGRWEPWAVTAAAALEAYGPATQVTVRGWPTGPTAAAELVDLLAGWLGDVVAVAAAPAELPAAALPGGERVAWALLAGDGVTVLVSTDGPRTAVRFSLATARLDAGPDGVAWQGGDRVPLLAVPPAPEGLSRGLWVAARSLAQDDPEPRAADAGDLLVVARVLEALRTSARTERWVEVGGPNGSDTVGTT